MKTSKLILIVSLGALTCASISSCKNKDKEYEQQLKAIYEERYQEQKALMEATKQQQEAHEAEKPKESHHSESHHSSGYHTSNPNAHVIREGGYTNLRSGAYNGAPIKDKIKDGTPIRVEGRDGDWCMVVDDHGDWLGYMHKSKVIYY